MKRIQLKDGNTIQILEKLEAYTGNQVYFKIESDDKNIKIISETELNALIKTDEKNFSKEEKLSLFYSYFRGRPDVYAIKYYDKRGKPGFSPHGDFNWVEMNDKYTGETRWQKDMKSYYPYTIETIKKHIMGNHPDFKYGVGIYPMLTDDTCYLLVMDFDKENAEKEAQALVQAAEKYNIPFLVERSQSGIGIHIWFFFAEPISAKIVREMGSLLISAAMRRSEYINFGNFDRMIPMQDTLTQNGFGNLIALPLRWEKVQEGKTVFLDGDFNIAQNQWAHLSGVKKLSENEILNKINELNKSVGFSKKERNPIESLTVYHGGEIKIKKESIPRSHFMQLASLATFNNPDFIIRQKMRTTTWNTPRYITGASEDGRYFYLPRGIFNKIKTEVKALEIIDNLSDGASIDVTFKGELREDQQKAVNSMLSHSMGILSASTGFGKTVVAAKLIAENKLSTLIIVHSKILAKQWKERLNEFLDIGTEPFVEYTPKGRKRKKGKIGEIHSAKTKQSKVIDIALFQTLSNREDLGDFVKDYGLVIVDEAHHVAAQSFESVIKQISSRYLYGLSATPERKDGYTPLIGMRLGEIIYEHQETQADAVLLPQYFYPRFTNYAEIAVDASYANHLAELLGYKERNGQIIEDVIENANHNRTCLVLTERIEHIQILNDMLERKNINCRVFTLTGQGGEKANQKNISVMKDLEEPYILLATSKYIGEGFDLPQLDTIFLTLPISWKGRLRQYLGRLQREVEHKDELRVYDYIDLGISMFANMYQKRLREYKKLGYMMAEDRKTKALEARLYDSTNYHVDLQSDFQQAGSIIVGVPILTTGLVKVIFELGAERKKLKVITKRAVAKNGKVNNQQKNFVDEVEGTGVDVGQADSIAQSFIILDNEIAWYGNISFYGYVNSASSAIRLKNTKLAGQIVKQYRD